MRKLGWIMAGATLALALSAAGIHQFLSGPESMPPPSISLGSPVNSAGPQMKISAHVSAPSPVSSLEHDDLLPIGDNASELVSSLTDTGLQLMQLVRGSKPIRILGPEHDDLHTSKDGADSTSARPSDQQPEEDPKIKGLMAEARRQLARYRLTLPAGDNCYETYQQILTLDPSGRTAAPLLADIGGAYRDLALAEKAKGRLRQGLTFADKGVELMPDNAALIALRQDLHTRLAEQNRIKEARIRELGLQKKKEAAERQRQADLKQEAERERLERLRAKEGTIEQHQEQEEAQVDAQQPEAKEEDSAHTKRLFGTF